MRRSRLRVQLRFRICLNLTLQSPRKSGLCTQQILAWHCATELAVSSVSLEMSSGQGSYATGDRLGGPEGLEGSIAVQEGHYGAPGQELGSTPDEGSSTGFEHQHGGIGSLGLMGAGFLGVSSSGQS